MTTARETILDALNATEADGCMRRFRPVLALVAGEGDAAFAARFLGVLARRLEVEPTREALRVAWREVRFEVTEREALLFVALQLRDVIDHGAEERRLQSLWGAVSRATKVG